jgi:hypothetical protein
VRGSDRRQTNSDLRQFLRDAEDLRRALPRDRELGGALNQALQGLRQAADSPLRDDSATAALLREQVVAPLRSIEVELAKRLQTLFGQNQLRLSDPGEAPERYRRLVDQYYKRLSTQDR